MLKNFRFTAELLLAYLMTFHTWRLVEREWVIVSGVIVSILLGAALVRVAKQRYFVNRWDIVFHAVVIADLFLEAILIGDHSNFGFYGCAAGFGLVLVAYRSFWHRRNLGEWNRAPRREGW